MAVFTPITQLDTIANPSAITAALLPATPGLTFDNASLHVVSGATSIGSYDGSLAPLGIGAGLLLTSGTMPGIVNTSTSFGISNNMVGDPDLDAVVNSVFHTFSYDATTLSVNFTVTDPSITAISFNLVFGSDEFPEWVNQFVDIGVVLVNGVNVAYFNNNPLAPLSVIGSNLANGYFINNTDGHLPIEYDGISAPLTVFAPVHQGLNTLKIGVADTGDHILDSGLFVSNMIGSNVPVYGVTLDLNGTQADDILNGGNVGENIQGLGGNDTITGGGGDDIVKGGDGDDDLSGNSGNDFLDGGLGLDIAKYAGAAANYTVVAYTDGTVKVLDNSGGAGEGLDVLSNIETIQFADSSIDVSTLPQIDPPPPGGAIAAPVVNGPAELTVTEDGAVGSLVMNALLAGATPAGAGDVISITGLAAVLPAGVTFTTIAGGFLTAPSSTLSIDPTNTAYQSLAAGETTTVSVDYSVTNAIGSTPNTAVFTVIGTNDAPVVAAPLAAAATEGGATLTVDALANASDIDNGAVLSIVEIPLPVVIGGVTTPPPVVTGNHGINSNGNGAVTPPPPAPTGFPTINTAYTLSTLPAGVSFDAATNSFHVDPTDPSFANLSSGQIANLTIHYGVSDGNVVTATSATITVTGANGAPTVSGSLAYAASEDSVIAINPLANVADPDLYDTLTVTPGTLPAGVSLTAFNAGNAAYQSLAAGEVATVTWDYTVSDGTASVANSAAFTVTGTNDAPVVVVPAGATIAEDAAPVTVSALAGASDVDHGAVLSVVDVPALLPAGISYDAATQSFSIDPADAAFQFLAQGEAHTFSVGYGISDGTVTTPTSVNFTVIGVNDAPVLTGPTTGSPNEDGVVVTVNATGNATDVDAHQGLQVTGVPGVLPAGVTYDAANQRFSLDPTDAAFQYLSKGETATVSVAYNVFDGFVEVPTSVIYTVTGKNDTPTVSAVVEAGVVAESAAPVTINLLANAADVDHLDVLNVRTGQGGLTASVTSGTWAAPLAYSVINNQLSLDPTQFNALRAGENVGVTFDYVVTDGAAAAGDAAASAHVTITGENDAPVALAISSAHIAENTAAGAVVGQLSATDPDRNETFSYQLLSDPRGYFAVSGSNLVVAAGAAIDFETATSDSLQVQVTDGGGASFVKTFAIAIDNVAGVDITATTKDDIISPTGAAGLRTTNEEDIIDGRKGLDTIDGGGGNDTINGGLDKDIINGGAGDDRIIVTESEALTDVMNGGAGSDTLVVTGTAALSLQGFNSLTNGIEVIQGNNAGIIGTSAADTFNFSGLTSITGTGIGAIDASGGNDSMVGSNFADILRGGAGNDNITGGGGNDILSGGAGADTFVFNASFGTDTITDFTAGAATGHDVIDLSSGIFGSFAAVQAAMTQVGANVVIGAGLDGAITINATTVAALVAADFAFH